MLFEKTMRKVFMVFINSAIVMKSIRQQIIEAKKEKREREEELWFVDYCNNCKTGLAFKNDVPCHHKRLRKKQRQLIWHGRRKLLKD